MSRTLLLSAALTLFSIVSIVATRADIIWNGPLIVFTEPAGGVGNDPANQDRLTSHVWLTRNTTEGLFNAAQESTFTDYMSPVDTEWAYGDLSDYATLSYNNWMAWTGGPGSGPPSTLGKPAVVHLISDNIYLSVEFLTWGGKSGGFSYQHSTALVPEPSTAALSMSGLAAFLAARRSSAWRRSRF